ncbi:hypothetical protein PCLA_17f0119 [Pseudomonas citronellolis]|nr:hypothetical protein PCLA_17f0119 [Pseudomonas citronellolis]
MDGGFWEEAIFVLKFNLELFPLIRISGNVKIKLKTLFGRTHPKYIVN